ncbi:MerR family transcriptional regulator [Herbidospora cretacea]|uniref:MerR family transcriptional regulator n=1 Tax=Herbidospora cretacea TaxID=28444 RepID=UPI0004C42EAD|nr:MerR family transcriptional regulator [Herbidospora cretacea]
MRISQLSETTGVPIPTIKYYLREGLLPTGEQVSATRSVYGAPHVRRLRLIRALLEVGKLPISAIRAVIEAVEDETMGVHEMLGTAHYALSPKTEPEDTEEWADARAMVDELIRERGWRVEPTAPGRAELAQTIVTLRRLGQEVTLPDLRPYAAAVGGLVRDHEMSRIPFDGPRETAVEAHVIGTVLYGRVLDVVRRLAEESESARLLADADGLAQ